MTGITRMQTIFLVLKHTKICISNFSVFQKLLLEKNMISFQIKARHLLIGPEQLCQPEIGYTTLNFFQINTPLSISFQINTPTITLTSYCSSTMVGGLKNKFIPRQHLHLHQHQHQRCLQIGTLHHLCKMSGLIHSMLG
jgi:hypothetical protein